MRRRYSLQPLVFVLPAVIFTFGFILYPIIYNVLLSMQKVDITGQFRYVGLTNYKELLQSPEFLAAFVRTMGFSVATALGSVVIGLFLAICVHHLDIRNKTWLIGLLFVPWIMGFVETGIIWKFLLHPLLGPVGQLVGKSLLGNPKTALAVLTAVHVWKHIPFALVTFYAALQNFPREIYEAACVDGANAPQIFFKVTIPQLRGIGIATTLLITIWQFGAFTLFDVMTGGGPLRSTEVLTIYIYKCFEARRFGAAGTASVILFVAALVLTTAYLFTEFNRLTKEEQ